MPLYGLRWCTCFTTRYSALDLCCGSNGIVPDRDTLNQQADTSPEINTKGALNDGQHTPPLASTSVQRLPLRQSSLHHWAHAIWRTCYLMSSNESTMAPLPHSQYLTSGQVLSSSVVSPRRLGGLWQIPGMAIIVFLCAFMPFACWS